MKPEDIQNALADIGEDLIENAADAKPKRIKRHIKKWQAILAATLAFILVLGVFLLPTREPIADKPVKTPAILSDPTPFLLSSAVYPLCASYPFTYKNFAEQQMLYDAWDRERREKANLFQKADIQLDDFFVSTMQEILTDTNGKNSVYSPINIYLSLALLAEISDGESQQQILKLLDINDLESLREKANALWRSHYTKDGMSTLTLANSLWFDQSFTPKEGALQILREYYFASAFRGNMSDKIFQQAMVGWINDQTGGILKNDLSDLEIPPETVMTLISTIYFQAKWIDEFEKNKTEIKNFNANRKKVSCEFMNSTTHTFYFTGEKFSAICYGLQGQGGMWLVLPNKGTDLDTLLKNEEFCRFIKNPDAWKMKEDAIVHLSLPKFNIGFNTDLITCLKNLGVQDIFNPYEADFSTISDLQTYIKNIVHTTRCMIDEEGCTAAAVTVSVDSITSSPDLTVHFTLDRPFYFQITSNQGAPLFAGVVNDPTRSE